MVGAHIMNVYAEKKPRISKVPIMFTNKDEVGLNYLYNDALMVTSVKV